MSFPAEGLKSATRPVRADVEAVLRGLQPGQRIRLTQTLRVGQKQWTATVEGAFREVRYLATGLSTDRVPEDDVVVPTVHFTKDNGELSSIALDEHSRIEVVRS